MRRPNIPKIKTDLKKPVIELTDDQINQITRKMLEILELQQAEGLSFLVDHCKLKEHLNEVWDRYSKRLPKELVGGSPGAFIPSDKYGSPLDRRHGKNITSGKWASVPGQTVFEALFLSYNSGSGMEIDPDLKMAYNYRLQELTVFGRNLAGYRRINSVWVYFRIIGNNTDVSPLPKHTAQVSRHDFLAILKSYVARESFHNDAVRETVMEAEALCAEDPENECQDH